MPSALQAQRLNYWTTKEVSVSFFIYNSPFAGVLDKGLFLSKQMLLLSC